MKTKNLRQALNILDEFVQKFQTFRPNIIAELDAIDNGQTDPIPGPEIPIPEPLNISRYEKPKPNTIKAKAKYYYHIPIDRPDADKDERFDMLIPENLKPNSPVMIYIHGGGFQSGNKGSAFKEIKALDRNWDMPEDIDTMLNNGIAFISLGYKKVTTDNPKNTPNIRELYERLMYSYQYIKYHLPNWNISRNKTMFTGISAGSIFAQWLHFGKDKADQNNPDPVKQMSTKPLTIAVRFVHTNENVKVWEDEIFKEFGFNMLAVYNSLPLAQKREALAKYQTFYDIERMEDLYGQKFLNFVKTISSLDNIDASTPEFWLANFFTRPPKNMHELGHHGKHAKWLHEYCLKQGQTNHTAYWGEGANQKYPSNAETWMDFVLRKAKE